jgi:hypothetical protein
MAVMVREAPVKSAVLPEAGVIVSHAGMVVASTVKGVPPAAAEVIITV